MEMSVSPTSTFQFMCNARNILNEYVESWPKRLKDQFSRKIYVNIREPWRNDCPTSTSSSSSLICYLIGDLKNFLKVNLRKIFKAIQIISSISKEMGIYSGGIYMLRIDQPLDVKDYYEYFHRKEIRGYHALMTPGSIFIDSEMCM